MTVLAMLLAFLTAATLTWRFCDPGSRLHILDHPNERSLHERPTPRTGGVALLAGVLTGAAVLGVSYPTGRELGIVLLCSAPLAAVSFLDDRRGVSAAVRIAVHLVVAAALIGVGYAPDAIGLPGLAWAAPWGLRVLILILFVVWMINLYNFMDGIDGFAGGMAVIGFTTFAILGGEAGNTLFAGACWLVAAAAAGFLLFNFPPARIFLGDTGSSSLGFLVAAFSLWAARDGLFPLWVAVLVFSPFIVDATVTLARRLLRGERPWQPHRSHYYQRLVQIGWGHRRTVLVEYLVMLSCGLSALFAVRLPPAAQIGLAVAWLLAYAGLMLGIGRLERHRVKAGSP